jgi:RNA polymerase sigma-70 factor (ECF subfamily)
LQETFTAAIAAFPRFRGEAAVGTWLYRIAVNVAHTYLRQRRPYVESPLTPADAAAPAVSAAEFALRRESERLYHHLEKIDPRKRIALLLHVVDGHSIAEVAALMGASQTATKSRIFWARRELLRRLQRDPLFRREDEP